MTQPVQLKTNTSPSSVSALRCPNMIAIASGKGGVGKTWFAITLCHTLSKLGKKVLLFDGDIGLANVDIQLGLTPENDLSGVVEGKIELSSAITRYKEGGFDIIAGHSGSGSLASLATPKLANIRSELMSMSNKYDLVAVDLGAGVDRSVRQMAGPAAITYVILTDEPTSLTDAYAFIKLSRAANPQANLSIVVNMASNANEGQRTFETISKACETFLGYSPALAGVIRRDNKVRDAIRSQTSLITRSPSSDAAKDVESIAKRMIGK